MISITEKKGASFTGYTEAILLMVLFALAFAGMIAGYESLYGGNYDETLGLDTDGVISEFSSYQNTQQEASEGKATFESQNGLTLSSSWKLIKATFDMLIGILTGGFIEKIADGMQMPSYFALIFRILWFISLGFIIIALLMKWRP